MTNTESQRKWLEQKFPRVITGEKRAKVMILRNDRTGTPLVAKRRVNSSEIERPTRGEVQNESELNCGTVATSVEPEIFVL